MGVILENLDLDDISEAIIENIVDTFTDYKLSNEDMLEVVGKVEEYFDEVRAYVRESENDRKEIKKMKDGKNDYEITCHNLGLPSEVILTKEGNGYRLPDEFIDGVNEFLADKYGCPTDGWAIEIKVSHIGWDI